MKTCYGIVILNYLNYSDTIECVNSIIEDAVGKTIKIVIIDNNSPNSSYEELIKKYINFCNIKIIKLSKNIGYSRGNNVGIYYLKKMYNIDNVLVLNNDTMIINENFLSYFSMLDVESLKNIGAMGTKIIGKDSLNQNPVYKKIGLKNSAKFFLWLCLRDSMFYKNRYPEKKKNNEDKENNNFYLHGSAIFLTKNFLKRYGGFYVGTFLYYEENILAYILQKERLVMEYVPSVSIFHKEDMSSAMSFSNDDRVKKIYIKKSIYKFWLIHLIPKRILKYLNKKWILNDYEKIVV